MADTIQLRAGNKSGMPTLLDRELAYVRDENALYMGTDTGNKKIGAALEAAVSALQSTVGGHSTSISSLNATVDTLDTDLNTLETTVSAQGTQIGSLDTRIGNTETSVSTLQNEKLSASKAAAQSNLAADAELETVVAAFNALVAAMKASGLMNT